MHAISASGELRLLPPPLAGEGGGGGELAHINLFACPLPIPPPQAGEGTAPNARTPLCVSTNGHALQLVRGAAIALEIGVFEKAARLFETFLVGQHVAFVGVLLVGKFKRHGVELLAALLENVAGYIGA
jgi:hypothetical protein